LDRANQRHTANVARARRRIGRGRAVRSNVGDPEPPVAVLTVDEELPVARLEDMKGLWGSWEEHDR